MSTDQPDPIPPGYRPRRSPLAGLPMIAEADRPDAAELAELRKEAGKARRLRGRSHPDRPVCP